MINEDSNIIVTRIEIIGFASPEGTIEWNETLSKVRANALKEYLSGKIDISSNLFQVEYRGENWDGLVKMLEDSEMARKDEVLSIINNTNDVRVRKNKLKVLNGGIPYREMLTTIYPQLRKVICNVYYTVKNFSVDEVRIVLNNKPYLLSLNEMFQIANTYPEVEIIPIPKVNEAYKKVAAGEDQLRYVIDMSSLK